MADREIVIRRVLTITVRMPVDAENEERYMEYERNLSNEEIVDWMIDVYRDGENEITTFDVGNRISSQAASIYDIKSQD